MILDTSALIAIANDEPERAVFVEMILNADHVIISAPSLVEASIVLYRLAGSLALTKLSQFLNEANVEVAQFSSEHVREAVTAYQVYGRGSGSKAALNYGDCFSYALAKCRDEPLLFKGNDFTETDIKNACVKVEGD